MLRRGTLSKGRERRSGRREEREEDWGWGEERLKIMREIILAREREMRRWGSQTWHKGFEIKEVKEVKPTAVEEKVESRGKRHMGRGMADETESAVA